MEPVWQRIAVSVQGGKWGFVGDPPLPDCDPHASLRDVLEALLGDGWELAPEPCFCRVAPICLRRRAGFGE